MSEFAPSAPVLPSPDRDINRSEFWIKHWSDKVLHNGQPCLKNPDTLPIMRLSGRSGNFIFITPDDKPAKARHGPFNLMARIPRIDQVLENKLKPSQPIRIVGVDQGHCERSCADLDGKSMLLNLEDPNVLETFDHEYMHCVLGQTLGETKSRTLAEGVASYLTERVHGDHIQGYDSKKDPRLKAVDLVYKKGELAGLSHTQFVRNLNDPSITPEMVYEYSYMFGAFLSDFVVRNYGLDKLLDLYAITAGNNFYNSDTGDPLIQNGRLVARENELIARAMKKTGIDPTKLRVEFDQFLRTSSAQPHP